MPLKARLISTSIAIHLGMLSVPTVTIAQELPSTLRQGMPYAEARQILLDAGWQAAYLSPMRERFGAMDYIIELGYNEVTSCSGTGMGFCAFEFVDAYGNKLAISTTNNQRGQEPTLFRWWLVQE